LNARRWSGGKTFNKAKNYSASQCSFLKLLQIFIERKTFISARSVTFPLSTSVKICIRRRHTSESRSEIVKRLHGSGCGDAGDSSELAGDIHAKQAAPPTTSYTQEAEHLGKQRVAVLPMMVILGLRVRPRPQSGSKIHENSYASTFSLWDETQTVRRRLWAG
jgi:hypothetical protein